MIVALVPLLVLFARAAAVAPPELAPPLALEHGLAAVLAECPEAPATWLVAKARHESHFDPLAAGRGKWPLDVADYPRRRHYACGVGSTIVRTPAACVALRPLGAGYRAMADEMREWGRLCRRMGKRGRHLTACRRAGYSRGVAAARAA